VLRRAAPRRAAPLRALKTAPEVAKPFSVAIILIFFLNNDPHM
jgi:hypothetical protein